MRTLYDRGLLVIDLSADFRLRDAKDFAAWYGHPPDPLHEQAVYGLPEVGQRDFAHARLIAVPGCYPTAAILALAPLLASGLMPKTGLSSTPRAGSVGPDARPPNPRTFPRWVKASEPIKSPEATVTRRRSSKSWASGASCLRLTSSPCPGILATCYAVPTDPERPEADYRQALENAYGKTPFVTVIDQPPDTTHVRGSNRAHLFVTVDERARRVIAMCAIDNLTKGASGQAVQCMNRALGFAETDGLDDVGASFRRFPIHGRKVVAWSWRYTTQDMPSGRRRTLLGKLMGAYLVLTLGLLGAFGLLAHALGRRALDEARTTTGLDRPSHRRFHLSRAIRPTRTRGRADSYLRQSETKIDRLKVRTLAARIELLDPSFRIRVDTEAQIPIGAEAFELAPDRAELEQAMAGKPCASVFFRGKDGQFYKRGYAPIFEDGSEKVIGIAAIWGSTEYFRQLGEFRRWLLLCGGAGALLVIAVSVAVARRITQPLEELARRAERIGQGDLSVEIPRPMSRDEVGLLGEAMAQMRRGLAARDQRMQMMLAGIAHEIRNPLGGMELFAGLLREELQDDPAKLAHTSRIERELGHLKRIVGEFLDFARRARPELGAVDCAALLSNVQELVENDCARGDCT